MKLKIPQDQFIIDFFIALKLKYEHSNHLKGRKHQLVRDLSKMS